MAVSGSIRKPARTMIGREIDQYCSICDLTFIDLARQIGVHPTLIAHIRHGRKVPSMETIDRIRALPGADGIVREALYARGIHPVADRVNRAIIAGGPTLKCDIIADVADYLDTIEAPR